MAPPSERHGEGRAKIQICVPDSYHVSGGPFCCFIKVAPIASDPSQPKEPLTLDFIAINVYGRACFRERLLALSKQQSNLRFSFLTEERENLKTNENAHLLFSSDSVIFSTNTEISPSSPEVYYRFTCTIPPFLPPTVEAEYVSCNYYVEVAVQYNSCSTGQRRETVHRKLEFLVVGSIYTGVPTLDDAFHPFLPKRGGYKLEDGKIADGDMRKACAEIIAPPGDQKNMFFNFNSKVEHLGSQATTTLVAPKDTYLMNRDLNAFWHVWDTLNASGFQNVPEESYIVKRYDELAEMLTNIIMNDPTGAEIESFRPWFGSLLQSGYYDEGNEVPEHKRAILLKMFLKNISSRVEEMNNASMDEIKRAGADSLKAQMDLSLDDSIKVMNFSLDGQKLCTCNFQGFGQLRGSKEFTVPVNSWLTVFFDFKDPFRCLQVDLNITRTETAGVMDVRTSHTPVFHRSVYALGKSNTSITLFLPIHTTPSFECSFLQVSYKIEICFYHFSESVDFLTLESLRSELTKLGMLSWANSVRVLQSESIRVSSRCYKRDELVPPANALHMAQVVCRKDHGSSTLQHNHETSTSVDLY